MIRSWIFMSLWQIWRCKTHKTYITWKNIRYNVKSLVLVVIFSRQNIILCMDFVFVNYNMFIEVWISIIIYVIIRVIHVSLRFRYCEYKGVESYSFISVNYFTFLYQRNRTTVCPVLLKNLESLNVQLTGTKITPLIFIGFYISNNGIAYFVLYS